ncbi:hypothetical protein RO787_27660 [Blautia coccoides]|uniref:hypothetical protein n=1 Tax=Blautia producta TaxID=33035 RepID=UPI0028A2F2D1|nr:hypothetical protein [Blautia coccoides]MDT4377107.1 hypothetical protein [Blautia coccoides]
MSAKPILFNTDMVRAILDGRKTMTRRAIKPQPAAHLGCKLGLCIAGNKKDIGKFGFGEHECGGSIHFVRPPCNTGDILYIRETWARIKNADGSHLKYVYQATDTYPFGVKGYIVKFKWRPSIHMPKAAARIWLRVTDVRVERLRDITPDGAIKEGIHFCECPDGYTWKGESSISNCYTDPIGAMQALWDTTIKKPDLDCYGWDANPWVWVIKFERCEKPEEE